MKRTKTLLTALLCLQLFVPVCFGIALALGWEFIITGTLPFFIFTTVGVLSLTVQLKNSGFVHGLATAIFPVSIINGLICLWVTQDLLVVPCVILQVLCCGYVFSTLSRKNWRRTLVKVFSTLLSIVLVLMCLLELFAGVMSRVTTVQEVSSPEGTYTAQLIDADYGATGGDTLVRVWDNSRTVYLPFSKLTPRHREIYRGDWGEFQDMTLSWQDDSTLMINERAYPVG